MRLYLCIQNILPLEVSGTSLLRGQQLSSSAVKIPFPEQKLSSCNIIPISTLRSSRLAENKIPHENEGSAFSTTQFCPVMLYT